MRIILSDARDPAPRSFEFSHSPVSIGSDSGNTLQLASLNVPDYLAVLKPQRDNGREGWVYVPLNPQAEITLNGQSLRHETPLSHADEIRIDRFSMKVELFGVQTEGLDEEAPEKLFGLRRLERIQKYPLPPGSEIQRPEEKVALTPPFLREHARVGVKIGQTRSYAELIDVTLQGILKPLQAQMVWMGMRRHGEGEVEYVGGLTPGGKFTGDPSMREALEYRCMERLQHVRVIRPDDPSIQSILAVPVVGRQGAVGWLYAQTKANGHVLDVEDLDFMTAISAVVAAHADQLLQDHATLHNELSKARSALVREVQNLFQPSQIPIWSNLQISVVTRQGLLKSGDLHDVLRLQSGLGLFFVGTVEAEPFHKAIAVPEIRTTFRVGAYHADRPHILLREINQILFDHGPICKFHGMVVAINPKTGVAEFCSAGDIGAIVVNESGKPRLWTQLDHAPLGQGVPFPGNGKNDKLKPGETLAVYTMGCEKARNAKGKVLGRHRLIETLCDGFGVPVSTAMNDLLVDLSNYLTNGQTDDDCTILLAHKPVTEA